MRNENEVYPFWDRNLECARCRADFVDFWMGHHPVRQGEYLNDSYFRPELSSHLAEYRKAVENLTIFEMGNLANITAQLKTKDEEIKGLKESVAKLQATVDMMLQGIMERDKQYFGKKYPRLRAGEYSSKRSTS
jgi:hypothetical protein